MDVLALETEAPSLLFDDTTKRARFELGVCMAIYSWDTLTTAVDSNWGGSDSEEKRQWLAGALVDLFDQQAIDAEYIEEFMLNVMLDEFETVVEDESAGPIAKLIIEIYRQVAAGDFSKVNEMYKKHEENEQKRKQGLIKPKVVVAEGENGDDDDDEDDEEEDGENNEPKQKQGPIVDDDGFELVQRKKR